MIYKRTSKHSSAGPDFIQLREEHTKALISGFASDGHIRLKDDQDNVWAGVVEQDEELVRYRLKDAAGRHMTGIGNASVRVFRDDYGKTWRGVVD
jgi:hypothetical protein